MSAGAGTGSKRSAEEAQQDDSVAVTPTSPERVSLDPRAIWGPAGAFLDSGSTHSPDITTNFPRLHDVLMP